MRNVVQYLDWTSLTLLRSMAPAMTLAVMLLPVVLASRSVEAQTFSVI